MKVDNHELQNGDFVRGRRSGLQFIVSIFPGDKVLLTRYQELTHPQDFEYVAKPDYDTSYSEAQRQQ